MSKSKGVLDSTDLPTLRRLAILMEQSESGRDSRIGTGYIARRYEQRPCVWDGPSNRQTSPSTHPTAKPGDRSVWSTYTAAGSA